MINNTLLPPNIQFSSLSAAILLALSPFNPAVASDPVAFELMHAHAINIDTLEQDEELVQKLQSYLASEKLDGIRAVWTGKGLVTRQGNPIVAPSWFTETLPKDTWLEGELWIDRNQFQLLSSIVRDHHPNEKEWQRVKFMVFDSPSISAPFQDRVLILKTQIQTIDQPYIQLIPQHDIANITELEQLLETIRSQGGEGIMLHRKDNLYQPGRSQNLIKVKPYQDDEAIVIGYVPGKGKYHGIMGAVWVTTSDNRKFKIGSGFSDHDRQYPPPLGSIVQYRFNGYTDSGLPRFARFLRVRSSPDS
ncbi:putative DNA ligase [Photobacterium gaetbulicola Gung47]|uniref:Putative DNA ligase n=2 Tax=Photobacterium gaetbulicola TaxID=1295392 RepID=A0A0C5WEN3_9GAMM|nr:putative DNA ligase [Photobacterium gaetbulicola Gung47]